MGHTDVSFTLRIYVHAQPEALLEAAQSLNHRSSAKHRGLIRGSRPEVGGTIMQRLPWLPTPLTFGFCRRSTSRGRRVDKSMRSDHRGRTTQTRATRPSTSPGIRSHPWQTLYGPPQERSNASLARAVTICDIFRVVRTYELLATSLSSQLRGHFSGRADRI